MVETFAFRGRNEFFFSRVRSILLIMGRDFEDKLN